MVDRWTAIGQGPILILVVSGAVVLGTVALIMLTVRNSESDETEVEFKLIGFKMHTKRGAADDVRVDVKNPVDAQDSPKKVLDVTPSDTPRKSRRYMSSQSKRKPKTGRTSKHGKRTPK